MLYRQMMECYSAIKKEWNSDSCYNVDEPWKHYAVWKKTHTRVTVWQSSGWLHTSTAWGPGSIPGQGTKILWQKKIIYMYIYICIYIYIYIHIYTYIYTHTHISSLSIHLLMDACSSILVIVNNAAINVRVQRTGIVWFYLHEAPRKGKFRDRR